jgi:hypothetical protein
VEEEQQEDVAEELVQEAEAERAGAETVGEDASAFLEGESDDESLARSELQVRACAAPVGAWGEREREREREREGSWWVKRQGPRRCDDVMPFQLNTINHGDANSGWALRAGVVRGARGGAAGGGGGGGAAEHAARGGVAAAVGAQAQRPRRQHGAGRVRPRGEQRCACMRDEGMHERTATQSDKASA